MSGKGTFVPLSFAPGEAFQFDWSEDWTIINRVRTKLQVAHFTVSASRAFLIWAYLLQTCEMLFDAHGRDHRQAGEWLSSGPVPPKLDWWRDTRCRWSRLPAPDGRD
jgi:hypothetical protein